MPGPAATVGDMHVCPMCNPNGSPHVGGPITGPGVPSVLIGSKPAAVMGDMCTCAGPADMIVQGEATVLVGGKPLACMNDLTAHGGGIAGGNPTVLIGTGGSGATAVMPVKKIPFPKITPVHKTIASLTGKRKQLNAAIANQEAIRQAAQNQKEITLSQLSWQRENSTIGQAKVGEMVALYAKVEGIENGKFAVFRVYEKDSASPSDFVISVGGIVKNNEVRAQWQVSYTEDTDAIETATALQERRPSLPEYIFTYDNSDGTTVESNLLEIEDALELNVINGDTQQPLAHAEYSIALPNGDLVEGQLDANGYARIDALSASKNYPIVFSKAGIIITTVSY